MSIEIYYYSGTGNSLHVAKELQKRIPEADLIPIISLLGNADIETKAETVGFVFPIYLMSIPAPVRKFLKRLDLKSVKYCFAIATHEDAPGRIDTHLEKILKKKGKTLDAYFTVKMAGNSPKYIMPNFMMKKGWVNRIAKDKILALEDGVLKELDKIQEMLLKQEKHPQERGHDFFLEHIVPVLAENTKTEIQFYADSGCTGCGLCEKICLSQKIKIMDGKPVWQKNTQCYYCYACFNYCPTQSILIKNAYAEKNGRYHHPDVSPNEIARQKE